MCSEEREKKFESIEARIVLKRCSRCTCTRTTLKTSKIVRRVICIKATSRRRIEREVSR